MKYFVSTSTNPSLGFAWGINVPSEIRRKIVEEDNVELGMNLVKSILVEYVPHPTKKNAFYRILNGHKFLIDHDETDKAMIEITNDFLLHGEYEPHTTKIFESLVKEGDVAVDVGASIGYFTLVLARLVGKSGIVISVEPSSNQFPYLRENINANEYDARVDAYNVGAWSATTDDQKLKVNTWHKGPLQTVALDEILPKKVDFIKIDTDGAEPEVLKGLEKTIQNNPQLKMVIEFYPQYIKNMGLNPQDMIDFLDKYFTYEKIEKDLDSATYWNYLCTRKDDVHELLNSLN